MDARPGMMTLAMPATPSLLRRLGSLLYDSLTFAALGFAGAALYTVLFGVAGIAAPHAGLQLLVLSPPAGYFLWCWSHGGQTLAMKTWRIRVTDRHGMALAPALACRRFLLAGIGLALGGASVWWVWLDAERQFLHDRLAGTRLVSD